MITENKYLSTVDSGTTWTAAPQWVTTGGTRQQVIDMAARNEWAALAAADPATYREWKEPGTAWLGYEKAVIQANPEPSDNDPVAAVYLSGTAAERSAAQRESLRGQITLNRTSADVSNIDLREDSGREVLMDEANSQSETRLNELAATADADLDAFDPTLDPLQIGSIATASSLYKQTERVLATDPTLDAQQVQDLEALKPQYAAIVTNGDDAANVPVPTDNVRLKLGVVAEGYGTIQCRRFDGLDGWWWLEFEVRTDRELSVAEYWIAVYSEGTYLTTPQLTDMGNNVYVAGKLAVNLPHTPPKQYEFSLCHQHISNQQFDPIVLAADENEAFAPIGKCKIGKCLP